jgi:hypothetical protein
MKKVLFFLFVCLIAIPVFSEEAWRFNSADEDWKSNRAVAITFNPVYLIVDSVIDSFGISPGLEYAFHQMFSVKAQAHFFYFDPSKMFSFISSESDSMVTSLRVALELRWYPNENRVNGFFINGGVHYFRLFGTFYNNDFVWKYDEDGGYGYYEVLEYDNSSALGVYFGLGYKWVIGKRRGGFVIESSLDYISSFHFDGMPSKEFDQFDTNLIFGTQGLRFNLVFGVAF